MTNNYNHILGKHENKGGLPLIQHLRNVEKMIVPIAKNMLLNENVARKGALLHDIGKTSHLFQKTMRYGYVRQPGAIFRHEIASLFFLSLVNEDEKPIIVEMIAGHHKSILNDVRELGLLDLDDLVDSFSIHAEGFPDWMPTAIGILKELGFKTHSISIDEAWKNYKYAIEYCEKLPLGYSEWKGLLMAADHMASAMEEKSKIVPPSFILPNLSFYNRTSALYPLSTIDAQNIKRHTLVTAPTGAGKTDFLLRRCRSRVFYTLPYQASINAMYERIKRDLASTDALVTLLHSASHLKTDGGTVEEQIMQRQIGSSVKIMTPHQMASVVFGIKGYESMLDDLKGCDIILDEIHTYTSEIQAIVLRIIEILKSINCRIHVGTATMPTLLYQKILSLLGGKENVYEVRLSDEILETYNRHIIHKIDSLESSITIINDAIKSNNKVLIVCNQVKRAQKFYQQICEIFPNMERMLIHSRFKRNDRAKLERNLQDYFNNLSTACIVVSTQVVEVSLDISFDTMITECAPIDAMIQRFGRVNRKRSIGNIGQYKDIYVIKPSDSERDALPYKKEVLIKSFEILPTDDILQETELQKKIDTVYPDSKFLNLDYSGVIFVDGQWQITKLCHNSKSEFLNLLEINSVVCIKESDKQQYLDSTKEKASEMEIPISFHAVSHSHLDQLDKGIDPYVIPDKAYSSDLGILSDFLKPDFYKNYEII